MGTSGAAFALLLPSPRRGERGEVCIKARRLRDARESRVALAECG